MRTLGLFLRCRRGAAATIALVAAGGFALFWAREFGRRPDNLAPVLVFCPLACACALAMALNDPFGEIERAATGAFWRYRLLLVAAGLLTAGAVLGLALGTADPRVVVSLVRNLCGFTGLAGWAALWLGARLAWLPAVLYAMAMYLTDAARNADRFPNSLWAWPLAGHDNGAAWLLCGCLAVGIGVVIARGARLPPAGDE